MVRAATTNSETNGRLLELSQRDLAHETPGPYPEHGAPAANSAASDPQEDAVPAESIITQVTRKEQVPPGTRAYPVRPLDTERADGTPQRSGWRTRFRSLFCCGSPVAREGTYPRKPADAVVIRPPQPPTPPRYTGEAQLGPVHLEDKGKKTLILDLDETLVHSSFKPIPNPDYIIPVEIEGRLVDVYVLKRPWLDEFIAEITGHFEIVVFTASLAKYADPLLDLLDQSAAVRWRLFRESCYPYEGNYVKDLACLGRELATTIIVDNSPHSYVFQPDNALPIGTFIDDMDDQELLDILPVLFAVEKVGDVRQHLGSHVAGLQSRPLPH